MPLGRGTSQGRPGAARAQAGQDGVHWAFTGTDPAHRVFASRHRAPLGGYGYREPFGWLWRRRTPLIHAAVCGLDTLYLSRCLHLASRWPVVGGVADVICDTARISP